jgi:hypothetical protein
MIVQSVTNSWDIVYNQYRNTEYRTLIDPKTDKKVVEVIQYVYDKKGEVHAVAKGRTVDIEI